MGKPACNQPLYFHYMSLKKHIRARELFPPMNQVALFFEESGQPFYWALGLQSGPKNKLKQRKRAPCTCMLPRAVKPNPKPRKTEGPIVLLLVSLCRRGFRPGNLVRLRVYCGGDHGTLSP